VDAAAEIRKWECANNLPRAQIVGVHPQGAMIPGGHDQFVASQMDVSRLAWFSPLALPLNAKTVGIEMLTHQNRAS
jgi:hypothetical protein